MPWQYPDNIPPVAINWSADEQRRCIVAANSTLEETGDEEQAIFACISAAGHSEEGAWRTNMERKTLPMIVTKIEPQGIVEHLVAVMGNVDLGGDVIHPGAFTKTINERLSQIKVLDSHRTDSVLHVLGRPLQMWEVGKAHLPSAVAARFPEATGALMAKTQFLMDTPEGKGTFIRIRDGAVDKYSIGYDAIDVDFSQETVGEKDITVRNLRTIKLWEYGPVVFAMNPATATVSAKHQEGDLGGNDATGAPNLPPASREHEWDKASARPVLIKAHNLGRLVNELYSAFYRQYPDSNYTVYWVKEIWDEYLIVSEEAPTGNKTWQIGYTADENGIIFVPMAEWLQVEAIYVPVPKENELSIQTKVGRVISKATATRMRSAMNGMQSALTELITLLADAGIVDEDEPEEDDDDKGAPAPEQAAKTSQDRDNAQAGPDTEPPTSTTAMLALIDVMRMKLSLLEV